jgi:H+/Cl- antiporter ClcA
MRVAPFNRVAHVLSGLTYNRRVGPVVFGLVTGLAAIGFRELIRFFNFILLERAWAWAEATPPYGRAALPVITGGGWLVVGLLVYFLAPEAKGSGGAADRPY